MVGYVRTMAGFEDDDPAIAHAGGRSVMVWRVLDLSLGALVRDSRVQPRESINLSVVTDYAMAMAKAPAYRAAGLAVDPFPPLVAFHERNERGHDLYWLADGWHRALAADEAGLDTFAVEVREGGVYDAILFAAGANARHGMRRTNRDKHRAVRMLFDHPTVIREGWGNARIAHAAGTSEALARTVRREREMELGLPESRERRGSDGKVYSLQLRGSEAPGGPLSGPERAVAGSVSGEGGNGAERVVLHQCTSAGCDAVTTEVVWHCPACGSHLSCAGYPPERGCPVCDGTDRDAALTVLAVLRDVPLPVRAGNGTGQAPYSPGRLRPSGAVLEYERLVTALDLLEGLESAPDAIVAESPDPAALQARVYRSWVGLDGLLRALGSPVGLAR